jgi:predicted MFS family arabinose efflux permease
MALLVRARQAPRELVLFISASLVMGFAFSMVDSTFNNFLNDRFALSGFQRSFLEFPRELPGFLVVFVTALLWFLCSRRLGAAAMLFCAVGALLVGFASSSYTMMVAWLFIYSMGQHLYMPVASTIGMELAREGQAGQRLGQLNAIRNLATILGSFFIFLGFKYLGFTFQHTFGIAAACLIAASILMLTMRPEKVSPPKTYLQLHKEYKLYYILAVISGARKQLFLTFAPWVLVKIFEQPTQIMATLYTIGGVIGILFQPLLGRAVDRLGEKLVLAAEGVILIFVCLGYGFAKFMLPEGTAFLVVCGCFLVDQMIFSVGMARSTYMKKIAMQPSHIQPALTASVTLDHIFSIAAALVGGVIWNQFGFQYVFLMGGVIALIDLAAVRHMRVPKTITPSQPALR